MCACACACAFCLSLSRWAGSRPTRVLTRLMGFHTPKYTHTHAHTLGHTIMLKINMSESYVWSQTNKHTHTHPHMHTLWYKRICQAPTLYTCKTNGLQYIHTVTLLLLTHFQKTQLHTPARTETQPAVSSVQICHYMSSDIMVDVTRNSSGGVLHCKSVFWA